jgi:hypothetical protein
VGGGLSTNPHLAQRLGAFVSVEEIPDVWAGVVGIFRDYGYRRLRTKARLKFLVADWGTERFREVLEKEYLGGSLPDGPAPLVPPPGDRDHIGVHRQRDGRYYLGVAPSVGRTSGTQLARIAQLAAEYGRGRIRTTAQQQLVILDVPADRTDALVAQLEKSKFAATPRPRATQPASEDTRHIPSRVKRAVWQRDDGRCTYVDEQGRRCTSRRFLEYDHALEFARGGEATVDNLRLRCRPHNQFAAEQSYGAEFMRDRREASQRAASRAYT